MTQMKIDNAQQNRKNKLCGETDETLHHMISEWSKLAQKGYKSRHAWVGKVFQ